MALFSFPPIPPSVTMTIHRTFASGQTAGFRIPADVNFAAARVNGVPTPAPTVAGFVLLGFTPVAGAVVDIEYDEVTAPDVTFFAPLVTDTFLPVGQGSATFTRATTATVVDHEGIIRNCLSGEVRFTGARRVRNLYAATATLVTQNITALAGPHTVSFTGAGTITFSGAFVGSLVGTGAATRVSTTFTSAAGLLTSTVTGSVTDAQAENVTGQSNTNPSEYVSNGVLAAPFHGTHVDGVKCFRHLNGNTVAANVVTEARGADIPWATLKKYLAEGARTNLALQSEDFSSVTWIKTNVAVTANNAVAPDGTTTADTLTATLALGTCLQAITVTTASQTVSCWVKRRTGTGVVNLSADGVAFTAIALTASWQRFTVTQSLTAGVVNAFFRIDTNGDAIDVWGAQYETASSASSYTPTTTVAVTRNADALTYPSSGNVGGMAGTFYAEVTDVPAVGQTHLILSVDGGSAADRFSVYRNTAGNLQYDVAVASVSQAAITVGAVGAQSRAVVSYATNSFSVCVNGGVVGTDTVGSVPSVTAINVGKYFDSSLHLFGNVGMVRISSYQVSDALQQELTR